MYHSKPSLEEVIGAIREVTESSADWVSSIPSLEFEMVSCCNMPAGYLYKVGKEVPLVQEAVHVISEVLTMLFQIPARESLSKYQGFVYLFDEVEELDPKDTQKIARVLDRLKRARDKIDNLTSYVEVFPLFEVHCYTILQTFRKRIQELELQVMKDIHADAQVTMKDMIEGWVSCQTMLREQVADEQKLEELQDYIISLQTKIMNPQEIKRQSIKQQLDVMQEFQFSSLEPKLVEDSLDVLHWPLTVKVDLEQRRRDINKEKIKFMEALAAEKKKYAADFIKWQKTLEYIKSEMEHFDRAKEYDKTVSGLRDALQDAKRKIENFRKRETLFNIELSDSEPLEELMDTYEDYYKLWNIAIEFTYSLEEWNTNRFSSLDAPEIAGQIDLWYKTTFKMTKMFDQQPVQHKVASDMLTALKAFQVKLPLIEAACHE